MQTPINPFKAALKANKPQIGLWCGLADSYSTEICAGAGFDWLLLDGEHAPGDPRAFLHQLQTVAAYPGSHPIGRIPLGHGNVGEMLIKQYLDLGFMSLLVPMVDTPEQAQQIVRRARYPQNDDVGSPTRGIRGMANTRANRFGRVLDYAHAANAQVCMLVQAETQTALDNIEAIAAIDGVDGIFIGPSDLAAAMGHLGNPKHPEVQEAIKHLFGEAKACGKASGILAPVEEDARRYIEWGVGFIAVGSDLGVFKNSTQALRDRFAI